VSGMGAMAIDTAPEAFPPVVSVACAVNVNVPATVGVPETVPDAPADNPVGSAPPTIAQV
jgi:hypothetical protein